MSEELSLVIKNQQAIAGIRHIDWNKDELIERVRAVTAKYKGLVYTDDDITNARTDRAELNAIKNSISDSRIQVKKFVMAPYDQFEAEVAEVTNLIIEAVKPIDEAIKTHDENQKADKKKQLVSYFDSIIGNLAELRCLCVRRAGLSSPVEARQRTARPQSSSRAAWTICSRHGLTPYPRFCPS